MHFFHLLKSGERERKRNKIIIMRWEELVSIVGSIFVILTTATCFFSSSSSSSFSSFSPSCSTASPVLCHFGNEMTNVKLCLLLSTQSLRTVLFISFCSSWSFRLLIFLSNWRSKCSSNCRWHLSACTHTHTWAKAIGDERKKKPLRFGENVRFQSLKY